MEEKGFYIRTIEGTAWLLAVFLIALISSFYFVNPVSSIAFIGVPLGICYAFLLPFLWHRGSYLLSTLITAFSVLPVAITYNYSLAGAQSILLAATLVTLIWLLFKQKFITYIISGA